MAKIEGWDHFGCGSWRSELPMPPNWRQVTDGNAMDGDKCFVTIPPYPKRHKKNGQQSTAKGKWEIVDKENIGQPIKNFQFVIRGDG